MSIGLSLKIKAIHQLTPDGRKPDLILGANDDVGKEYLLVTYQFIAYVPLPQEIECRK